MNGTPPPFDPSKPFTHEGSATPPPFDPNKPFTVEGAAPSGEPPGFFGGMVHAIEERGAGLAQLAARSRMVEPGLPAQAVQDITSGAAVPMIDRDVNKFERDYAQQRAAGGSSASTRAGEIVGGFAADTALTAPLALAGGFSGGLVTNILRGAAIGAEAGAITGAVEPVTDAENFGRHKAEQIGLAGAGGAIAGGVLGGLGRALAAGDPALIDQTIKQHFYTAVRPSNVGRTTSPARTRFETQARGAIDAIIANKPNLKFGEGEAGRLPRTLEELSEAIDQTKTRLINQYDAQAVAAGGKGVKVDLKSVAQKIDAIADDKYRWVGHPEGAAAAKRLGEDLYAEVTPSEAQSILKGLNERSRGAVPSTALPRSVYLEAASAIREQLYTAIESVEGAGYGDARRAVSTLMEIEKDVGRATGNELKKQGGLWGKGTDIFAAGELILGGVTGNWKDIAVAGAAEAGKMVVNYLRSPNRAVQRLFELAERGGQSAARQAIGHAAPLALPGLAGSAGDALLGTMPMLQ